MASFASKQEFLDRLDARPAYCLEVFDHAKQHLLAAIEEVAFDDFTGQDHEIMNRLQERLRGRRSESALWGCVAVDLWFCNNFGGPHWQALVERDKGNIRFAIQAAYWIFAVSAGDGSAALAAITSRYHCWSVAERWIRNGADDGLRAWWRQPVVAPKNRGSA